MSQKKNTLSSEKKGILPPATLFKSTIINYQCFIQETEKIDHTNKTKNTLLKNILLEKRTKKNDRLFNSLITIDPKDNEQTFANLSSITKFSKKMLQVLTLTCDTFLQLKEIYCVFQEGGQLFQSLFVGNPKKFLNIVNAPDLEYCIEYLNAIDDILKAYAFLEDDAKNNLPILIEQYKTFQSLKTNCQKAAQNLQTIFKSIKCLNEIKKKAMAMKEHELIDTYNKTWNKIEKNRKASMYNSQNERGEIPCHITQTGLKFIFFKISEAGSYAYNSIEKKYLFNFFAEEKITKFNKKTV